MPTTRNKRFDPFFRIDPFFRSSFDPFFVLQKI